MKLDTDFNVDPYNDDYAESKNFHRFLFQPEVAVQARELTQLQTMLQEQVERFGDSIFKEGTIIKGCSFNYDASYDYIKVPDLLVDGQPTNVAQFSDAKLVNNSNGLEAIIIDETVGLETQAPDLNTFYIKYINTGTGGEKVFVASDLLTLKDKVTDADLGYQISVSNVAASVGKGYSFKISDGIIFQKGNFIRVEEQSIVIEKYGVAPDAKTVGFVTKEEIITENIDTSLFDNSSGFDNENAPGSHRLKLTPELSVKTTTEAEASDNFFVLVEWELGNIIRQRQETTYSSLGKEMARRTQEESGDYVVKPFIVTSDTIDSNSTHVNISTSSGLGYINGYRVEQYDTVLTPTRLGDDIQEEVGQIITPNYGNYVLVNEVAGNFGFATGSTISLRSLAGTEVTDRTFGVAASGSEIGTARLMSFVFETGVPGTPTAQYRAYLTDILMNEGKSFADVKSIFFNGTNDGVADLVLESTKAVLKETDFKNLIFPFGQSAISTLRDIGDNNNTSFIYRKSDETTSFTTGTCTITLSGSDFFPYSDGTLNETQEKDVVVISRSATSVDSTQTGTVDITNASADVAGTSTLFLTEYKVGQFITVAGTNAANETRRITAIASNVSLTVDAVYTQTLAGAANSRRYPPYAAIPITSNDAATIVISGSSQTMTINLDESVSMNTYVYYNIKRNTAKQVNKC